MSKEMELLDAILSAPSAPTPKEKPAPKPKPKRARKEKKKEGTLRVPEGYLLISKEELRSLLEEAVRRGLQEGLRLAREPTEENIVRTVWNSEPSGVKLSNLCLVFGKERANEVQQKLLELERKNILLRDRNRWWHINPDYAEAILMHYGIEYTDEELQAVRTRLRNRIPNMGRLPEPDFGGGEK